MFSTIQVFTITRVDISRYISQQCVLERFWYFCKDKAASIPCRVDVATSWARGIAMKMDVTTCYNEAFGDTKMGKAWQFGYNTCHRMKHKSVVVSVAQFSTNMQEKTNNFPARATYLYHYIKIYQVSGLGLCISNQNDSRTPRLIDKEYNHTSQLAFQRFTAQRTNNQTCYCLTSWGFLCIKNTWQIMKACEPWDDLPDQDFSTTKWVLECEIFHQVTDRWSTFLLLQRMCVRV